jgi:hypothetical protein
LAENLPFNQGAAGSNPARLTFLLRTRRQQDKKLGHTAHLHFIEPNHCGMEQSDLILFWGPLLPPNGYRISACIQPELTPSLAASILCHIQFDSYWQSRVKETTHRGQLSY